MTDSQTLPSATTQARPLFLHAVVGGLVAAAAQVAASLWARGRGDLEAGGWAEAPVILVFGLVALAVAYGAVTPRVERPRGAVLLGAAAVLVVAGAFWNPAPVVLGIAAIGLGRVHRSTAAMVLGAIAAVAPFGLLAAGVVADAGNGGDLRAWCRANQTLSNVDPTEADPVRLERNVTQLRAATGEVVSNAPDDIREASGVIGRRFPEYLDELEQAGYDASKVDSDAFFSDAEVSGAGAQLDEYADVHCEERAGDN